MKKYGPPVLEEIQVEHINQLMDQAVAPGADAKQNVIIFEEFIEEEPDTTGIWSNDPWKIQYSLWEDE